MTVKIAMLNDEGLVAEEVGNVHVCVGDPTRCMDPAWCETCGNTASPGTAIYVWTTSTGLEYFACAVCISGDDYIRLVQELETGDVVAVLSASGAVAYYAEVTSLPGSEGGKYGLWSPETDEVHSVAEAGGEGFREATEAESDDYIERWGDGKELTD